MRDCNDAQGIMGIVVNHKVFGYPGGFWEARGSWGITEIRLPGIMREFRGSQGRIVLQYPNSILPTRSVPADCSPPHVSYPGQALPCVSEEDTKGGEEEDGERKL